LFYSDLIFGDEEALIEGDLVNWLLIFPSTFPIRTHFEVPGRNPDPDIPLLPFFVLDDTGVLTMVLCIACCVVAVEFRAFYLSTEPNKADPVIPTFKTAFTLPTTPATSIIPALLPVTIGCATPTVKTDRPDVATSIVTFLVEAIARTAQTLCVVLAGGPVRHVGPVRS